MTADEETPLLPNEPGDKPVVTPVPWGQLTILLFMQLSEPLVSQLINPFTPDLIRSIGITHGDETKVGYYVGLMQSCFYATQAMTVLHWARISDHIGRKPVLIGGLLGISLSMFSFGLSKTFVGLVLARCLNGFMNGNVGVMKSVLGEITDDTNMSQVYAYLPLSWSTGATLGPLIGGAFARPAERFPEWFGGVEFWKTYPYFLPCAISGAFASVAMVVVIFFFNETVVAPVSIRHVLGLTQAKSNLVLQGVVEGQDPSVAAPEERTEQPLPLRSIISPPVLIAGGNYALLSFVDIAFRGMQPLFFSTPVALGGLGLSPAEIGTILSVYGFLNGAFQVLCFAKLFNRFGPKAMFMSGMVGATLLFASFPLLSTLVLSRGIDRLVWTIVICQVVLSMTMSLSYGCIFIFINASSPNRASLGGTNGLCQMVVSWMRCFGPALSSSLFSFSLRRETWTVYWVMEAVTFCAIGVACLLPRRATSQK